jgi:hypothetical protein
MCRRVGLNFLRSKKYLAAIGNSSRFLGWSVRILINTLTEVHQICHGLCFPRKELKIYTFQTCTLLTLSRPNNFDISSLTATYTRHMNHKEATG